MLRRETETGKTYVCGFLVGVEMEENGPTTQEQVSARIADGLSFMEGVGTVDVELLGKIESFDESETIEKA